MQLHP
jgi:hypothetical protein